jgi:DNA repair protein RadD
MIQGARVAFRNKVRRVLLQLPTGGGKTAMTSTMVDTTTKKGKRAWFVVHRRELVNQVCRAFDKQGIDYGVISADYEPRPRALAQVVSVQTVIRRLERMRPPDLLVLDECHHAASKMWEDLQEWCSKSYILGLSATPKRLDGRGLKSHFDKMICGPTMSWLMANQFLAPYRLFEPGTIDMSGVRVVAGEFNKRETAARVTDSKIVGDAVREYQKNCNGARAVGFAVSIEHSQMVAQKFRDAGIPATHFDGGTDKAVRDQITRDLESGHIRVLMNVDLVSEGFDLPAIEAMIDLAPTMSESRYLQRVGRALRYEPGKIATLNDHVGNSARHGRPDAEREWSLEYGADKKKGEGTPSGRMCTKCFGTSRPTAKSCTTCGNPFDVEGRTIRTEDGELVEAAPTPEQLAHRERLKEQGRAHSLETLIQLGRTRYGNNDKAVRWANHVWDARQKKRGQAGSL